MKIKSALYLVIILLLASLFCFPVAADAETLVWNEAEETKSITVVEGTSVTYRFAPSESRQYALRYELHKPLGFEFSVDGYHPDFTNWMDENNIAYDIYDLTAGTEYTITFFFNGPAPEYNGTYTGDFSILPWENSIVLPDYPYAQENEKLNVTLTDDETVYYLFSPSQSGTYCLGKNTSNVHAALSPVLQVPNQEPHSPEEMGTWNTDTQEGTLYHLEKGNIYLLCIQEFSIPHGETSVTDTVWIRPGEAPKNEYPIWDISESKTVTLGKNEYVKYYLTPEKTGKYIVRVNGGIRFNILDKDNMYDSQYSTGDGTVFYYFELQAGVQYVVCLEEWASEQGQVTGTFQFEKVDSVKSASIYVANFASDSYVLGIDFDPICGFLEGVTWSISDPSVFEIIDQSDTVLDLRILKKGKATITATVGNITASIELTSDPKLPVLKEGQTLNMTIGGAAAEFTPNKSGKYKFTVIPNRMMNFSIFYDTDQDPIYYKTDFSKKLEFTINLNAGQKYELVQLFGRASVSVKYVGGSSSQDSTTPPAQATQPPATASPTAPSEIVTEPTQATEPTQVTETAPTETKPVENTPIGTTLITAADISDEDLIRFENTENTTFNISAEALRLAAEQGSSLSLDFPSNVNVVLYNNILRALSEDTTDEYITVSVTPQTYYDLNEAQQAALDGKSLVWLLDMTLTFDGISVHELGGSAQITLPNPDSNKDWHILYLAEDGTVELLEITGEEDISFTTDHFSHYALVLRDKSADTPGNSWIWILVIALAVTAGGGAAAFFIIKKKKVVN